MTTEILWCQDYECRAETAECVWRDLPHTHVPMLLVRKDAPSIEVHTGDHRALLGMPAGRYVLIDGAARP